MVFTYKLLMYQKPYKWGQWMSEISDTKTSAYIPYKALSMWCCVYFVRTETFIILAAFFNSLKKAKICRYTLRNDKQIKSICLLVKCLLITLMRVRIWGNPKITSYVNFLFWMLNWKWLNLRKWLIWIYVNRRQISSDKKHNSSFHLVLFSLLCSVILPCAVF